MKINKFIVEGLFDLRYDLNFFEDINFLHGINGCGKTTILNILSAIISGNLDELYKYDFKKVILSAQNNSDENFDVLIEKDTKRDLYIFNSHGMTGSIPSKRKKALARRTYADDQIIFEEYENDGIYFVGEANENDYVYESYRKFKKLIESNFSPIYLPLGRTNLSNSRNVKGNNKQSISSISRNNLSDMDNSLMNAIRLVKQRYTKDTYLDNRLLERLKTQIVTHTFNNAFSTEDLFTEKLKYTEDDFKLIFDNEFWDTIDELSLKTTQQESITLDIANVKERIKEGKDSFFFDEKQLIIRDSIKFGNYIIAVSQIKKTQELVDKVKKINEKRAKIKFTLNQLLDVVNRFFRDSQKTLIINEEGFLRFKRGNKPKQNNVNVMSSGEKQILIFFINALLQVNQEKAGIFMIDEPELSLHLEWQHIFINSLMEIIPDAQLIFATHSPEIIGDLRSRCIEVRGRDF